MCYPSLADFTQQPSQAVCVSWVSALLRGHNAWRRDTNGNPAGRSEQGCYNWSLQLHLLLSLCFRNAEKKNLCCFATENVCFTLNMLTGGFFHRLCLFFLSITGPGCSNQPPQKNPEKTTFFLHQNPSVSFKSSLSC